MSHPPIDPAADPGRRAWLACPNCNHGIGCAECQSSRNCATHWQYLLKNKGSKVVLQCSACRCVWTLDTAAPDRHTTAVVLKAWTDRACVEPAEDVSDAGLPARSPDSGNGSPEEAVIAKVAVGDGASEIVTSPHGDLVYVMTADSVKAISRLHHIVATSPIGPEPKRLMISPNGSRMYVTHYDGSLSIINPIDMTANTVAAQRSIAEAVSPDGNYIYMAHGEVVGDGNSTWISVVRADGASIALIAVDRYTTGMAVSPDGHRLYVSSAHPNAHHHGGTITAIDTASRKIVEVIPIAEAPETITVDREGFLHVTHYHTNSVSIVDPGSYCVIDIPLDDAPIDIAVSPDSRVVYATNLHSITAIDTSTAVTQSIPIGDLPRRVHISGDGNRLYLLDFARQTIWALDTADTSVVGTVDVSAYPAATALSPDGAFLYVTDSRDGTLTVISTALVKPNPEVM